MLVEYLGHSEITDPELCIAGYKLFRCIARVNGEKYISMQNISESLIEDSLVDWQAYLEADTKQGAIEAYNERHASQPAPTQETA